MLLPWNLHKIKFINPYCLSKIKIQTHFNLNLQQGKCKYISPALLRWCLFVEWLMPAIRLCRLQRRIYHYPILAYEMQNAKILRPD